MKKIFSLLVTINFFLVQFSFSQNVGIGTTTPHTKAALEVAATDKGILFPRLTTVQRDAISNPPNGLMIFNTIERCLNYYDSVYQVWNCYCNDCQAVVINITEDMCKVDFYNKYAKFAPAKKYIIIVQEDIYIHGCNPGDTALSFMNMPPGTSIVIRNYGFILGAGGTGGYGRLELGCSNLSAFASSGGSGGHAISTKTTVPVVINNYGVVAGGGGGGGGSTRTTGGTGYGGGGGGGAGIVGGVGGSGGGTYASNMFGCFPSYNIAQAGSAGTFNNGGPGGAGSGGGPPGGNGGNRGQPGQNGIGGSNPGFGGAAGKAIGGGSGNSITNIGAGQSFGVVD